MRYRPRQRKPRPDRTLQHGIAISLTILLVASAIGPSSPVPSLFPHQDKLEHLVGFAALSFAMFWRNVRAPVSALVLVGLGIGVEMAQALVPSRSPSLADAAFSLAGVSVGWFAAWAAVPFLPAAARRVGVD